MLTIIPNASLALGIIFYKERKDMAGNKIRSMHILKKETFVFAYIPRESGYTKSNLTGKKQHGRDIFL